MSAITNIPELQRRFIFALVVAGKNAAFAERVVGRLFPPAALLPFDQIHTWLHDKTLRIRLRQARSGNYKKLEKAFSYLAWHSLDLRRDGPEEFEQVPGVGFKTSRFFILWTRPDARYAALDVHILRWLRSRGYAVPKQTPQHPERYRAIEQMFLNLADGLGKTPAQLDAEIWAAGSRSGGSQGNW